MKNISIINYGCGNILSLSRAIIELGYNVKIIDNYKEVDFADYIILPGVGAFGDAMLQLKKKNFVEALKVHALIKKKPIIGICLGMQLFLSKSFEIGEHHGLNLIEGENILIKSSSNKFKIPHIDWENLNINEAVVDKNHFLNNVNNKSFYFVHSYMAKLENKNNIIAYCNYADLQIPAIIMTHNIIGFQFHPEKSGVNGLKTLDFSLKNL